MDFHHDLEESGPPPLPIFVVKHDKPIRGVLCCKDWVGVRTHWWGGHTIACCGTANCPACETQNWTKKYYIVARGLVTRNQAIIMLTPLAADMIKVARTRVDGFLGCEILVRRSAARNTSPMEARVTTYHADEKEFGQSRLERVITRIFRENAHGVG